jgi:hypothetical protein
MDKDTILVNINRVFGAILRPETMVRNPGHCDECADHEAVMQGVTPQTVTLNEVGSPGWDPVCFLSDEAFCYFMLGFARLALDDDGEYLWQFFFHLDQGFRVDAFNTEQRRAVAMLVDYIGDNRIEALIDSMAEAEFDRVQASLVGDS